MAGRDYLLCRDCGIKMIYDGYQSIRDQLEHRFGDPKAADYSVELLCPICQKKQDDDITKLRKLVTQRDTRMQIMKEWIKINPAHPRPVWYAQELSWENFIRAHPEAAEWFDEDGVPR